LRNFSKAPVGLLTLEINLLSQILIYNIIIIINYYQKKMTKTTNTSISLPLSLEKALRSQAKKEHRTTSGMIQEAVRYYLESKKWRVLQEEMAYRARQLGIISEGDVENMIDDLRS
jgi:predicted DNA-binding protein